MVAFTDTPELFGAEIRILAAIEFQGRQGGALDDYWVLGKPIELRFISGVVAVAADDRGSFTKAGSADLWPLRDLNHNQTRAVDARASNVHQVSMAAGTKR